MERLHGASVAELLIRAQGQSECRAEGERSALGEKKRVEEMMLVRPGESGQTEDDEAEGGRDGEDPETEMDGAAAGTSQQQKRRPEQIELLLHGKRPEMIERQRRDIMDGRLREDGKVLQEEGEDHQWSKIRKQ